MHYKKNLNFLWKISYCNFPVFLRENQYNLFLIKSLKYHTINFLNNRRNMSVNKLISLFVIMGGPSKCWPSVPRVSGDPTRQFGCSSVKGSVSDVVTVSRPRNLEAPNNSSFFSLFIVRICRMVMVTFARSFSRMIGPLNRPIIRCSHII